MRRWALFALSIVLMGIWFPVSLFRSDERWFFADNFGLNSPSKDASQDSVEQAWKSLKAEPSLHHLKNILHEWTKESPKRAAKFLSFLILAEAIAIGVIIA